MRTSPKFPVNCPSMYSSVFASCRFMYASVDTRKPAREGGQDALLMSRVAHTGSSPRIPLSSPAARSLSFSSMSSYPPLYSMPHFSFTMTDLPDRSFRKGLGLTGTFCGEGRGSGHVDSTPCPSRTLVSRHGETRSVPRPCLAIVGACTPGFNRGAPAAAGPTPTCYTRLWRECTVFLMRASRMVPVPPATPAPELRWTADVAPLCTSVIPTFHWPPSSQDSERPGQSPLLDFLASVRTVRSVCARVFCRVTRPP